MNNPIKTEVKKEGEEKKPKRYRQGQNRYDLKQSTTTPASPKFKGATEDLHRHIYDVGVFNQSDLFVTTTKMVANYAGQTCKEPQDI